MQNGGFMADFDSDTEVSIGAEKTIGGTGVSRGDLDASIGNAPTMNSAAEKASADTARSGILARIDQYDLIRKLGGGGFGVVYLVRDTVSDVEYALKTLHPLLKTNAEELERVRENFKLTAKLLHPNIAAAHVLHKARDVEYFDKETERDLRVFPGDPVMLMSYAPGVPLSKWKHRFPNKIVPLETACEIAVQVAVALDAAHGEKIVHRDIKPGNLMVETRADGSLHVRVLDFGLAAEIRSSMSRISTEGGDTSRTRPYMAPEQWAGRRQDGRTDQYALACVLYEMLCGEVPLAGAFETGDGIVMSQAVANEMPEPIQGLDSGRNQILAKALSKNKEDRFPSCMAMMEAFADPAAAGFGRSAAEAVPVKSVKTGNPLFKKILIGAGVGIAAVVTVIALFANRPKEITNNVAEPVRQVEIENTTDFVALPQTSDVERQTSNEKRQASNSSNSAIAELDAAEESEVKARIAKRGEEKKLREIDTMKKSAATVAAKIEKYRGGADYDFKKRFDSIDSDRKILDAIDSVKDYDKAVRLKHSITDNADWIEDNSAARGNIRDIEERIAVIMKSAEEAKTFASSTFEKASKYEREKNELLKESDFTGAEAKAKEALQFYKAAIDEANDVRCRAKLKSAREYAENELWEDSRAAAEEALKFVPSDSEAQKLKEDAVKHLVEEYKGPQPGDPLKIDIAPGVSVEMVYVAPGTFTMGSNDSDAYDDEKPVHSVKITKGYWIGKYEVTQKQWKAVMGDNPSTFKGDDLPVECVSWYDCQKFIMKLNSMPINVRFWLPTEAQWEFAARGGTKSKGFKYSGSYDILDVAWYTENSGEQTHPVGKKKPNELGIYDMSGNVWEWCEDWYRSYSSDSVSDPQGATSGDVRVFRSGSWDYGAGNCRSSRRYGLNSGRRRNNLGFRLACFVGQ